MMLDMRARVVGRMRRSISTVAANMSLGPTTAVVIANINCVEFLWAVKASPMPRRPGHYMLRDIDSTVVLYACGLSTLAAIANTGIVIANTNANFAFGGLG